MSVIDRFSQVVRSEWSHLRGKKSSPTEGGAPVDDDRRPTVAARTPDAPSPRGSPTSAMRILELHGNPSLDEVRAQYRRLARHYHPKTVSDKADEANNARAVLEALTESLEVLEEHLLPLPR